MASMRVPMRQLLRSAMLKPVGCTAPRAFGVQVMEEVDKFSYFNPTTLTLENFVKFGTKRSSGGHTFAFLSKELPVRFANIMKEFKLLPDQLKNTPSFQIVEDWYTKSFCEILQFKDANPEIDGTLERFNQTLANILARHATVVETMAQGVLEMKEAKLVGSSEKDRHLEKCVQYFLDRFYLSRIGLRMLINQHMHMFTDLKSDGDYVGAIDKHCDVQTIAEDAYNDARLLCEEQYMVAPDCRFDCRNPYEKAASGGRKITMTYVPTHLHHMLFEILKNSLRAVVETHDGKRDLPKINVLICKGRSDVTIKVSDQGGGIRRSEMSKLFSYTYSSAPRPGQDEKQPMAGYGYGLPLSHLYARYFNGDLWLNSIDGFGTDAMLCLKLFPCDASELLPVYNKTSLHKYTSPASPVSDWSDPLYNPEASASKRSTVGGQ